MTRVFPSREAALSAIRDGIVGDDEKLPAGAVMADGHVVSPDCWCSPEAVGMEDGVTVLIHREPT